MIISPRFYLGLGALYFSVISSLSHAAEEFEDNVPIEIVGQFLGMVPGGEGAKLYRDVMDGFPVFSLPDDTEVLASLDQVYLQRVLLHSSADVNTAVAALHEQFLDQGWIANSPDPSPAMQRRGFVTSGTTGAITRSESLCHPEYGILTLMAHDDMLHMLLSGMASSVGMVNCERNDALLRSGSTLMEYMPILEVPNQASMPPGISSLGGGFASDREMESRGSIQDERSIEELFTYFQEQVEDQNWTPDSQSIGSTVATGTWRKSEDDINLVGVLTIISMSDDDYNLRFRLVRQGGASSAGYGILRAAPAQ